MKKLTPEQIERILDENFGFANVKEAMLFMQDEVLRLNGITEMTPEQKRSFTQDMIADMNGEIEG